MSFGSHGGADHYVVTNPSRLPRGQKETSDEKKARQAGDIGAIADWRDRDNEST